MEWQRHSHDGIGMCYELECLFNTWSSQLTRQAPYLVD